MNRGGEETAEEGVCETPRRMYLDHLGVDDDIHLVNAGGVSEVD